MRKNYPKHWDFLLKPEQIIGKTITDAAVEKMEDGSVYDHCILFRFGDGTRAFFLGRSGDVEVGPSFEAYEKSRFFSPEELGEVVVDDKRRALEREAEARKQKERQLAQLQKELSA